MTGKEKRKELFDLLHGIMQKYRNDDHTIAVKIASIAASLLVLVDCEDDDSIGEIMSLAMEKAKPMLMMAEFAMQLQKMLAGKNE